jgi:glutaminase
MESCGAARAGEVDCAFSIMSVSKPFVFALEGSGQ